jgi:hypothetical protein
MNPKRTINSTYILVVMGLVSLFVSLTGVMILGMGEACCHLDRPGGVAYACFAWTMTLTIIVFLLFAAWPPAKPIIFWVWAGAFVSFLTAMNIRAPHSSSTDLNPAQIAQAARSFLSWSVTWAIAGLVGLSHIEAHFGTRTWGKRSAQGA